MSRYGHRGRRLNGCYINGSSTSTSSAISNGYAAALHTNNANGSIGSQSSACTQQQPKNPKLYKTELCRSWVDHGRCNYGDRCQYAHGEEEKRTIPRHPKYKTEYCQSYHESGYCPYGPRCHFIHNDEQQPSVNSTRNSRLPTVNFSGAALTVVGNGAASNGAVNGNALSVKGNGKGKELIRVDGTTTSTSHHTYSGSTGDSPVPSSTGSGSDSPVGSIDLDGENFCAAAATGANSCSWSTTLTCNPQQQNTSATYFNWPTATSYNNGIDIFSESTSTANGILGSSFSVTNDWDNHSINNNNNDAALLVSQFWEWGGLQDVQSPTSLSSPQNFSVGSPTQPLTPQSPPQQPRLPIFAQISNASSVSSSLSS
ncbi:unnamed protein product [Anisakis simplex]|uniref:Protein TIS11 (inferred by orthology to a D. melanogaster protein) n=1 Tax=Anisakis simplex TaxID=6269 RepID=A0A0M3KEG7_ANISI|nr:unnamed protein product [Anisakis simplex]